MLKTRFVFAFGGLAGIAFATTILLAQQGDMPIGWARHGHVHQVRAVGGDTLFDLVGCKLLGEVGNNGSVQCDEVFLYVGAEGRANLALGLIANVQVDGYVKEARPLTMNVLTEGSGRVDRAVVDFTCLGNVGECAFRFSNGWEFRAVGDALELVGPDGTLKDIWR